MSDIRNAETIPPPEEPDAVDIHNKICQLVRARNDAWTAASEQRMRAENAEAELSFWRRVALEVSVRGDGEGSIGVDTDGGEIIYGAFMCENLPMTGRDWYRSIGALAHALSSSGSQPAADGSGECGDGAEDPR